jgi:chromosome segregation ATPase
MACGGSDSAKSDTTAASAASHTPMEQLKELPKSLHAELETMTKPLDDLEATIDTLTKFPEKHHVDAASIMALAKARVDGNKLEVSADLKLDEAARAELDTALARLDAVVAGLKATPEHAVALGKKLVTTTAELPVLATRITTEANVKLSNPFAGAEAKASASKEIQEVTQVQADVKKEIDTAQAKVTELPALATKALGKLAVSFSGGSDKPTEKAAAKGVK